MKHAHMISLSPLVALVIMAASVESMMMQCDVESEDASPRDATDIEMDVEDADTALPGTAWRPAGPVADALLDWAPQFLKLILRHPLGNRLVGQLSERFSNKIMMITDFSGIGGPEIAMHQLVRAFQDSLGATSDNSVIYWSASDLCPKARQCLCTPSPCRPLHVFGDLMERLPDKVRGELDRVHGYAHAEFARRFADGAGRPALAAEIGRRMLADMHSIMQAAVKGFDIPDGLGMCYQCIR